MVIFTEIFNAKISGYKVIKLHCFVKKLRYTVPCSAHANNLVCYFNNNDNDLFFFSKLMAQGYNIYTTIYNVHMQSKYGKYS